MKRFSILSGVIALLSMPVTAVEISHEADNRIPTDEQRWVVKYISSILKDAHYLRLAQDAALSERVLERYLSHLDSQRIYLLMEDVKQIEAQWKGKPVSAFFELEQPFDVHALVAKRWQERFSFAMQQVDVAQPAAMAPARGDTDSWPASKEQQVALWQRQIGQDLWEFTQSGMTLPVAREKLKIRYQQALSAMKETDSADVFSTFANALCQAADPASAYFLAPPANPAERLDQEGIGMSLESDGIYARVSRLVEGGAGDGERPNQGRRLCAVSK